ncbi:MAG: hypothetical protein JNL70_24385 [Saprospiraceae bacterium]|nr:hypothetical protein [Saprospiraceae bacterium]
MKTILRLTFTFFALFMVGHLPATVALRTATAEHTNKNITLTSFSVKDYQKMVGKRLTWQDKIVFHFAKRELMKDSKTVDRETLERAVGSGRSEFNLLGFLLGFILSILGVLIALLFGGNVLRWAWKGVLISLLVGIIYWLVGKKE